MGHHQLDELDYKILKLVASNARIPFLEVARECNVSGAAIHQRVQKLTNLGILKGNPGDFSHVVEKLRKIPEVVECHFTTGQYDMFIKLFARNNRHLLEIIHTKLQPIGLSRTETLISFREIFRRQLPIEEVEDLD